MPKYEVVEVIRKYWTVEAGSEEEAYDLVIGECEGDLTTITLVKEDGETESITELRETTEYR